MARISIWAAHHPLQIALEISTEKGTGGLVGGPDGLFEQSDDFLDDVQAETRVYMLVGEVYDMKLHRER